ncbi:MAG TPA: Re/Si-specific NAD(P)(+) transhydrogenase subunit alpha [Caulobacteraceae bacterium]
MTVVAVLKERDGETRVALTPDAVKKLVGQGLSVMVETGAGDQASWSDADFVAADATVGGDWLAVLEVADVLLSVRGPLETQVQSLKAGAIVVALLNPHGEGALIETLARREVTAFAMEFVPRISRAQAMDALSSQANLAGYRSVIEAAEAFGRAMPMMMTPAGTIAPAKVFVMGAGVAGLQAIATARRLGAVVTATDVRPAAKEQVESLGAKFVAVEDEEFKAAETSAGYAKEMSPAYQEKQAALVSDHIRKQDIVITTALIPGRTAPRLVDAAQISRMRRGSVIVDMAVEHGGNVEGSRPDEIVESNGVRIVGIANLPGRVATDASALYARNLVAFLGLLIDKAGALAPDMEDEILKSALVTDRGAVVHPALNSLR